MALRAIGAKRAGNRVARGHGTLWLVAQVMQVLLMDLRPVVDIRVCAYKFGYL